LISGGGSSYLVALTSKLARQVVYVDNDLASFENVKSKSIQYQLSNVIPIVGNLNQGWSDYYPFDVILLTGSIPQVPKDLKDALAIKGRLFVVVGQFPLMEATMVTRLSDKVWEENKLFETDRPRLFDVKENDRFVF
jgi:protein-L-isoaspartate(D-aspartate) O-methyltransferase